MSYNYGSYRRVDYSPPKGTEKQPIEVAMQIFASWAKENDRNYGGELVKQNLLDELSGGISPEQAVRNFITRATRRAPRARSI
jgi:hypothetical protein